MPGSAGGKQVKPNRNDVLLGRGNGVATYQGNVNFRKIVWEYRDDYKKAPRYVKPKIAMKVVRAISKLQPSGRFIELRGDDNYYTVEDEKSLEKTCQALREKKNKCPDPKHFKAKARRKTHRVKKTLLPKSKGLPKARQPEKLAGVAKAATRIIGSHKCEKKVESNKDVANPKLSPKLVFNLETPQATAGPNTGREMKAAVNLNFPVTANGETHHAMAQEAEEKSLEVNDTLKFEAGDQHDAVMTSANILVNDQDLSLVLDDEDCLFNFDGTSEFDELTAQDVQALITIPPFPTAKPSHLVTPEKPKDPSRSDTASMSPSTAQRRLDFCRQPAIKQDTHVDEDCEDIDLEPIPFPDNWSPTLYCEDDALFAIWDRSEEATHLVLKEASLISSNLELGFSAPYKKVTRCDNESPKSVLSPLNLCQEYFGEQGDGETLYRNV